MKQEQVLLLKQLQQVFNKVNLESKINLARMKTLSVLVLAIISLQTVNLTRLSLVFNTGDKNSKYRKLQRFMSYVWDKPSIAKLLYALYQEFTTQEKVRLALDRTVWHVGKKPINVLMLGIVWKQYCLPLYWVLLDKKGISQTQERIDLISRVLAIISNTKIVSLLCDREFIGKEWIKWLVDNKIPFVIRVRNNLQVEGKKVQELFRGGQMIHHKTIMEAKLWICGKVLTDETGKIDYVITISNIANIDYLQEYKHRWNIECLFGSLKTRGFDLETTHLAIKEKVDNLLVVLAISYTWCCITGEVLDSIEPIKVKTHTRKAVSLFRYGLDYLQTLLLHFTDYKAEYRQVLNFLSCT